MKKLDKYDIVFYVAVIAIAITLAFLVIWREIIIPNKVVHELEAEAQGHAFNSDLSLAVIDEPNELVEIDEYAKLANKIADDYIEHLKECILSWERLTALEQRIEAFEEDGHDIGSHGETVGCANPKLRIAYEGDIFCISCGNIYRQGMVVEPNDYEITVETLGDNDALEEFQESLTRSYLKRYQE